MLPRICTYPNKNKKSHKQCNAGLTQQSVIYANNIKNFGISFKKTRARGGVVVKALRYIPAGRELDSRWCHWNFLVT
jgi:hypothetical protein